MVFPGLSLRSKRPGVSQKRERDFVVFLLGQNQGHDHIEKPASQSFSSAKPPWKH